MKCCRVVSVLSLLVMIACIATPAMAQDDVTQSLQPLLDKIDKVVRGAQVIVVSASVLVFIYAGYLHMTSEGDPNKEQKARKVFTGGLIGLGIVVLAEIIRNAVVALLS